MGGGGGGGDCDSEQLSLELSIGGGNYGISRSPKRKQALRRPRKKSRTNIQSLGWKRFRKNEKCGGGIEINEDFINLSLFTHHQDSCASVLYPQVQQHLPPPNPSSSPVSDYQTTSRKGGSSTDTGSRSSQTETDHHLGVLVPAKLAGPPRSIYYQPRLEAAPDSPNVAWSAQFCQTNNNNNVKPLHMMPCVTTTGNGPEGRTVRGFLYKYTHAEVSIVCVCHGSSFSPAEFVEHAGGVGVSHPLRHITVVRSTFG